MYAYIKGQVVLRALDFLVVENGGVGYKIQASAGSLERFPATGEQVTVHTHLYVREDQMALYGFPEREDLNMFELLLTVSGIGPKVASTIVGTLPPSQFALAVITGDAKALTQIRGIGRKGAERLILELKDKLKGSADELPAAVAAVSGTSVQSDAINALIVLGYSGSEAAQAVGRVAADESAGLEDIIRLALRQLIRPGS